MTYFKPTFNWLATFTVFNVLLYFALVEGIQGAANIVQFYIWLTFFLSWGALSNRCVRDVQKKGLPALPRWVFNLQGFAVLAALLWYGWLWSAAAWLLTKILASRFSKPLPAVDQVKASP